MKTTLKVLEEFGVRMRNHLEVFGVDISLSITDRGYLLKASYGTTKFEETLYWTDTSEETFEKDLQAVERQAMRALSS